MAKALDGEISRETLFSLHRTVQTELTTDICQPIEAWKTEPKGTCLITPEGLPRGLSLAWRERRFSGGGGGMSRNSLPDGGGVSRRLARHQLLAFPKTEKTVFVDIQRTLESQYRMFSPLECRMWSR